MTYHRLRRFAIFAFILLFLATMFVFAIRFIAPSTGAETSVNLGQEFTLKKGETAKVRGLNVVLTLTDFIYSPCPDDTQCFWSGLAVEYELFAEGKIYKSSAGNLPSDAPYHVLIKNSDYKTFATLVIYESEKKPHLINKKVGYLEGTITVGPLCPLEPCQMSENDRRAALTSRKIPVYPDQSNTAQAFIIPDENGNYRLELPPGQYVVGDKKYQGNNFSKDLPKEIFIEAGGTIKLNINIDTGIR